MDMHNENDAGMYPSNDRESLTSEQSKITS
jgi:hypothetical protein